jgi:hypothetical protein
MKEIKQSLSKNILFIINNCDSDIVLENLYIKTETKYINDKNYIMDELIIIKFMQILKGLNFTRILSSDNVYLFTYNNEYLENFLLNLSILDLYYLQFKLSKEDVK